MPFKKGLEQSGFVDGTKRFDEIGKTAALNITKEVTEESKTGFDESKPRIYSNKGYNIQPDIMSEQVTHADFSPNGSSKKKSLYNKTAVAAARQKLMNSKEGTITPNNKYIYFDKTDQKTGEFVNDVFVNGHDKMAVKSTSTTEAGGAKIESYFTEKGNLTSEITLNQGSERTDRKGFKNKMPAFLDKIDDLFIATNYDENEAAASYADEFVSKKLDKKRRKIVSEAGRFSNIKSEANKEIKSIKKEIKADKEESLKEKKQDKSLGSEEKQLFKESSARFSEPSDKFTDRYAKAFRSEMQDSAGKPLFVFPAVKHTIENNQLKNRKSAKAKEVNQKNVLALADKDAEIKRDVESKIVKQDKLEISSEGHSSKNGRTAESYFADTSINNIESAKSIPDRFMTNEEKLEQEKAKKKAASKENNKQLRRAAAVATVSNVFRMKKEAQNDLRDVSGNRVTGDLLKDGRGSILSTLGSSLSREIGNLAKSLLKAATTKMFTLLAAAFGGLILPLIIILACSLLLFVGYADSGEVYDLTLGGDGVTHTALTSEEIDGIITSLYATYNDPELGIFDMSSTQETILRYALSKVGCEYDQGKHWSLTEDIFDCSSLAMRAYREVGINIKNGDAFSASEECRSLENQNKVVGNDLIPGDLIFYGGQNNGRYRGIYHVAIYVGNGKMVEARSRSMGVVYGDVRSSNVVICARPFR